MDQGKIGAFIAQLRREKNWTQEELGERVGVTNKTVSRWENGNYMPSIEILSLLSRTFGVSLNELVQGQRLEEEADFRAAADENLANAMEHPQSRFWRYAWSWLKRNYIPAIVVFFLCLILFAAGRESVRYRQEHPVDVSLPGTFVYRADNPMESLYLTFNQDGQYYLFTPAGDYLEVGSYVQDGDIITVDTGETVRWIVVKGQTLYDVSPEGSGVLAYRWMGGVPVFIGRTPVWSTAAP